jgi:hypothetical protein
LAERIVHALEARSAVHVIRRDLGFLHLDPDGLFVEGALGTSIISIDVAHDHDDLQPLRFITFTTLYPVDFKEPIWVKMKKPKVAPYDMSMLIIDVPSAPSTARR